MFCFVTNLVLGRGAPFAEVPPLTMDWSAQDSVSLPLGLCDYWVRFMERCELGAHSYDDWYEVSHAELVDRFMASESMVSSLMLYCPEGELWEKRPLVFWVVHGTWSSKEEKYYAPNNKDYQSLLSFARELADRHRRPIEVVSYVWSGVDAHEARRQAGSDLRVLAEGFFSAANGYGPYWAFGHSHGVNVILMASQEVYFDAVISLGAPVLAGVYTSLHVGVLYHFYSLGDPWQKAGAVDVRSLKKFFSSLGGGERTHSSSSSIKGCYNFRVMFDALDPGHVSLKLLVPYFWDVIDTVTEHYHYHTHFNLNVVKVFDDASYKIVQLSIRDRLELINALSALTEDRISADKISDLQRELAYSNKQEAHFEWQYHGKKINHSSVWWRKILANWLELSELILAKVPFLRFGAYKDYSLLKERRV